MKKLKKIISLMLCVCITSYTLPVFATQAVTSSEMEIQKIMLSEMEMKELVGAGAVDVKVSDYSYYDTTASAVFINRSTIISSYELVETDSQGTVISIIASGALDASEAIIASGPVTGAGNVVQGKIWTVGFPKGITASHSSMQ